jgi:hypothetical protein
MPLISLRVQNETYIRVEINNKLNSGNVCYRSLESQLSFRCVSNNGEG